MTTLVGAIVKAGPWAGWRVPQSLEQTHTIGIQRNGAVGPVRLREPHVFICSLEDPALLKCTAGGIVLRLDQVTPYQPMGRVRIKVEPRARVRVQIAV